MENSSRPLESGDRYRGDDCLDTDSANRSLVSNVLWWPVCHRNASVRCAMGNTRIESQNATCASVAGCDPAHASGLRHLDPQRSPDGESRRDGTKTKGLTRAS